MKLIVCVPVSALPVHPDKERYNCSQIECPSCRELMWLGEKSKKEEEENGTPVICMICAWKRGLIDQRSVVKKLQPS